MSLVDDETLVRLCSSAFTSDEIKNLKSLLFDSVTTDQRNILRKQRGKEARDLEDIVSLLKSIDSEKVPVFVARNLERLPPLSIDHLDCTKLLKDLSKIQRDIDSVKMTYATKQQFDELRSDIQTLKNPTLPMSIFGNVNARRGAWINDSGPLGISFCNTDSYEDVNMSPKPRVSPNQHLNTSQESLQRTSPKPNNGGDTMTSKNPLTPILSKTQSLSQENLNKSQSSPHNKCKNKKQAVDASAVAVTSAPAESPTRPTDLPIAEPDDQLMSAQVPIRADINCSGDKQILSERKSFADIAKKEGEWKTVGRPKPKPSGRFLGRKGCANVSDGKFRAADPKVLMFITRVHKETTVKNIEEYVYDKTGENIKLQKLSIYKEKEHCAYKFLVAKNELDLFLNESLWPHGVIFRKFVHFKYRDTKGPSPSGIN
ncbi:uncharacterized protein LOC134754787 [Cydia strobilella]|uniref:uncharacterized protein LOC134754787 n=1 Tax=Cydia strobilella TaxID=1100964 RepID=UPI00300434FF